MYWLNAGIAEVMVSEQTIQSMKQFIQNFAYTLLPVHGDMFTRLDSK